MIRVLVADDHPAVREGLCSMLEAEGDMQVVGEAKDGEEAIAMTVTAEPDVVLMDVRMPQCDGISALREIGRVRARTHVIMLTTFGHENYVVPSFRVGAAGYLLKDVRPGPLMDAIRQVAAGRSLWASPPGGAPGRALSPRELEVLICIAREMSNRAIATEMGISEETVKCHVARILVKLDARDRSGAVLRAWRWGLLPPDASPMACDSMNDQLDAGRSASGIQPAAAREGRGAGEQSRIHG